MPKTFTDQTATVVGTSLNAANLNNLLTSADMAVASGLATLNGSSLVVQDPASKGLASGVAALDGSSRLTATATAGALTVNGQLLATGGGTNNTIAATGTGVTSPTINTASAHYGAITFITGSSPSSGTQVRVTMPFTYHAVILTPLSGFSGHGGAYQPEVNQTDSTHWDIFFNLAPAASVQYAFYFLVF